MGKICAFFGHRDAPSYLLENNHIERTIISLIENEGVDTFWFGGNGNFDSYANSAVRRVQEQLYPQIKRIFVAAYMQQVNPTIGSEAGFTELNYDGFMYPDEVEFAPRKFAITYRNRYEVENADFFICYIHKEYGGAYTAYRLAKRNGKKVINLAESEEVKHSEIEHKKKMEEYRKLYGDKPEYVKILDNKSL
ncbi:MAG: hypothetical protein NC218_02960 [Acetobacter sp.]|nr:hypothetical protein [Acetobacter sp.]